MLLAFQEQHVHQADHTRFRGAVVGLAEIAVHARRGRGHQDTAVSLLTHDRPDSTRAVGRAQQMHVDHCVEIVGAHLGEGLVAQDAGIVDQDIDAAPGIHRPRHHDVHGSAVADVAAIGDGPAARGQDLVGHGLRRAPEVVDHHAAATRGQLQRMAAAQPLAGAGHDGDAFIEANAHGVHP
ncbi:hypothetical protein G6F68_014981 [Rhizopus microsporus]|nr:hypothetical protein G6F68_014981 [Rhizopus microsporus]